VEELNDSNDVMYDTEIDWLECSWNDKVLDGLRYLARTCFPYIPNAERAVIESYLTFAGQEGITSTPLKISADNNNNTSSSSKGKSSSYSFWDSILTLSANNANHLLLAHIAKTVFCTSASEAACERIFSRLKLLVGDRRRKLNPTTAFYLLLLTL
jgi:hypothetical protein